MNSKLPKKDGELSILNGELSVLNVGDGDTKLSFDKSNPAERIRAGRIVSDMLKRGYALLIEQDDGKGGKHYVRAESFNPEVCEYVIADFDPVTAAEHDEQENQDGQQGGTSTDPAPAAGKAASAGKRSYRKRGIDASTARAVAVAPTAGG